ncbi:MAG: winged helix-turn-helix transcriptional regulator [Nostoc sp.]
MRHVSYDGAQGCYIEAAIDVIADKWKGVLLYHLLNGPKRFNELKRTFPELSQLISCTWKYECQNHNYVQGEQGVQY